MTALLNAIEIAETAHDNIVELKITGKLTTQDYALVVGELENRIKKFNKIRMLVELRDFHGWTAGAMWEDIKFDFKHFNDVERIAIVGENKWEKGMTFFFKPFTAADVRYFEHSRLAEAADWIAE